MAQFVTLERPFHCYLLGFFYFIMASDPAFLFYPGDYLRDTQCLSEKSQVAYDRIMCEHMRNICISQKQLNFFTKRLTDEEKEEIEMVLLKTADGFQIKWVAESILQRREYSESRRKNRTSTNKKPPKDMRTYDTHMEIEDEIENEGEGEAINKNPNEKYLVDEMIEIFMTYLPNYPTDRNRDAAAANSIFLFLGKGTNVPRPTIKDVRPLWEKVSQFISQDDFHKNYSLSQIDKHIQSITQKIQNGTTTGKNKGITADGLRKAHARTFGTG